MSSGRSGEVRSDDEAFTNILGRLENEVGGIISLVGKAKEQGAFPNTAPFWALVRMTFPIAESLGDLIYDSAPTINLESILKNEFEAVRGGYAPIAATLAILFRHSLLHQDEVRALLTNGTEVNWQLGFGARKTHLRIADKGTYWEVQFDTTAFYEDLVEVWKRQIGKYSNGEMAARYNNWLALKLDSGDKTHKRAITEIAAFTSPPPASPATPP